MPALHQIKEGIAIIEAHAGLNAPAIRAPLQAISSLAPAPQNIHAERRLNDSAEGDALVGRASLRFPEKLIGAQSSGA
jgi:hypothetical protein